MYFTTYLSTYPLCNNVLTQHNNVPDAHQGTKIFLPKFLWTSPIPIPSISMLKNNDWTTRGSFSFSGWIACKLHADPMIPQKPPTSNFSVKILAIFYILMNANPTIYPNFMVIGQFLFFGLFGIAPPLVKHF